MTLLPHTHPIERTLSYYDDRAKGLLSVLKEEPLALAHLRAWHPAFHDADDDAIRAAKITLDDCRLVFARQHGHDSWAAFAEFIGRLERGEASDPFLDALEAGKGGDLPRALEILRAHPDLVHARGSNGNSLLNLVGSLLACPAKDAVHDSPDARLAPMRALLDMGAHPDMPNERGWTVLHQAAYRNDPPMVTLLLDAGADHTLEAHGAGGTPLAQACFWGHVESAALLADAGVIPANLRIAAAMGRLDLVAQCFSAGGELTAAARASRAFYRPHSGFAPWRPTDDAQEILDEALVWASKSGRVTVMPLLLERGARINAHPYQGTPLMWAASKGRLDVIEWLLDHGAELNQRASYGGPDLRGLTALHTAAWANELGAVKLLVARGADASIEDEKYGGTPLGWAEHHGSSAVAEYMKGLG